jgi:predicted acyl esterase
MFPTVTSKSTTALSPHADPKHPHSVPILAAENEGEQAPDQQFAEGAQDTVDVDLRHRMISEAAYHRYVERGYADGYDLDDWLQAETDVNRLLLNPGRPIEAAVAD